MSDDFDAALSKLRSYWYETRESYAFYQSTKVDSFDCVEYHPPFFDVPAERFFFQKPGLKRREHLPAPLHVTRFGPQEYGLKDYPKPEKKIADTSPIPDLEKIADQVLRDEVIGEVFRINGQEFVLNRQGITTPDRTIYLQKKKNSNHNLYQNKSKFGEAFEVFFVEGEEWCFFDDADGSDSYIHKVKYVAPGGKCPLDIRCYPSAMLIEWHRREALQQ